jgi:hypothetical protein
LDPRFNTEAPPVKHIKTDEITEELRLLNATIGEAFPTEISNLKEYFDLEKQWILPALNQKIFCGHHQCLSLLDSERSEAVSIVWNDKKQFDILNSKPSTITLIPRGQSKRTKKYPS